MKIYTKTGDEGKTGLFGGGRVWKSDLRVHAYGEVDELNSLIGVVRSENTDVELDTQLEKIQNRLFTFGSELAANPNAAKKVDLGIELISEEDIRELEVGIDEMESRLEPMKNFILPGGTKPAALLHLARTVCRRVERNIVQLAQHEPVRGQLSKYINRLNDYLFVMARVCNSQNHVVDIPWLGRQKNAK